MRVEENALLFEYNSHKMRLSWESVSEFMNILNDALLRNKDALLSSFP